MDGKPSFDGRRVVVTGGGSVNASLLQVIASVFNATVYTATAGPNTASLGAAYRAAHGYACVTTGRVVPFNEIFPKIGMTHTSHISLIGWFMAWWDSCQRQVELMNGSSLLVQ
jgi:glycerol kinase